MFDLFVTIGSVLGYTLLGVIVLVLGWLIWKKFQRAEDAWVGYDEWLTTQGGELLFIRVPKENEKTPETAELFFASLHGILKSAVELQESGAFQEHFGLEIITTGDFIHFYIWTPRHLKSFIESQIYAQYPEVIIETVQDYASLRSDKQVASTELILEKEHFYPIKTFVGFDNDPLSAITSVLSDSEPNEEMWIQVLIRPNDPALFREQSLKFIDGLKNPKKPEPSFASKALRGLGEAASIAAKEAVAPGSSVSENKEGDAKKEDAEITSPQQIAYNTMEAKATKLTFETKIRLASFAPDIIEARLRLQSLVGAFKQFNTSNLNGFKVEEIKLNDPEFIQPYATRQFKDGGYVLDTTELASIYHLPAKSLDVPNIAYVGAKKSEPPQNLPIIGSVDDKELTLLAETDFRNTKMKFGIKDKDRYRHIYVIGKSGTGKTTLLENMVIDDIVEGKGVAVVDPHGDMIDTILKYIPPARYNDVIMFDPTDREHPIAFNILDVASENMKETVASGVVSIFEKLFSHSWGPRLEYVLRNTLMALLDSPDSTLLGVPRMFSDRDFRRNVIDKIKDPVVKDFWVNEYSRWQDKQKQEAVAPVQNKVGQFLSTSIIRNIVGQPKSGFNMREAIDSGKILLVKIPRGTLGEDNVKLLGAMIITQIQLAAMSRADIPESERREFYLYVDEFQNFATSSFATILSEARKYKLSLTVANQYISQLGEEVKDAVFGNIGTLVTFRVGASDAAALAKEFEPVFEPQDLSNLDIYKIYIKLAIDGITADPFSAKTLPLPADVVNTSDDIETIRRLSRERYAKAKIFVEERIASRFAEPAKQAPVKPEGSVTSINRPTNSPSNQRRVGGGHRSKGKINVEARKSALGPILNRITNSREKQNLIKDLHKNELKDLKEKLGKPVINEKPKFQENHSQALEEGQKIDLDSE